MPRPMFKTLRALTDAIDRAETALGAVAGVLLTDIEVRKGDGELEARLDSIELQLDRREAEAKGFLLQAQGQYKAAAAAEGRAKTREANADRLNDEDGDFDMEAYAALLKGAPPELHRDLDRPLVEPPTGRERALARKRARK